MSFDIDANGAGGFHHQIPNAFDLDDFDMVKLLSSVQFSKPEVPDAVQWAVEQVSPSGDMSDVVNKIAHIELMQLLISAVDSLSIKAGASDGFISLLAIQKHLLWANDSRLVKFTFSGKSEPGVAFMRSIGKALKDTDLSTVGVLFQLCAAVSKFDAKIGDSDTPAKLWIKLSH